MSKHLATVARKNILLASRNFKQNQALGGRASASTGWIGDREFTAAGAMCPHLSNINYLLTWKTIFIQVMVNSWARHGVFSKLNQETEFNNC